MIGILGAPKEPEPNYMYMLELSFTTAVAKHSLTSSSIALSLIRNELADEPSYTLCPVYCMLN